MIRLSQYWTNCLPYVVPATVLLNDGPLMRRGGESIRQANGLSSRCFLGSFGSIASPLVSFSRIFRTPSKQGSRLTAWNRIGRIVKIRIASYEWSRSKYIAPHYTAAGVNRFISMLKELIDELEPQLKNP